MYDGLRNAWNKMNGLRHGDRAKDLLHGRGIFPRTAKHRNRNRRRRIHKNKWYISNVVQECWEAIGRRGSSLKRASIGCTGRVLDIIIGCMMLFRMILHAFQLEEMNNATGFCLNRHYDATPVRVHFGLLAPTLFENARYPVKSSDGRWKLVSLQVTRPLIHLTRL